MNPSLVLVQHRLLVSQLVLLHPQPLHLLLLPGDGVPQLVEVDALLALVQVPPFLVVPPPESFIDELL